VPEMLVCLKSPAFNMGTSTPL